MKMDPSTKETSCPSKCKDCGAELTTSGANLRCNKCDTSKSTDSKLRKRKHIDMGENPYQCMICGDNCATRKGLFRHSRLHKVDKTHQCTICEALFTRKDHLERHVRNHLGVKPHKCEECGRSFATKDHLRRHARSHTGEKPYQCTYCDAAFSRKDHLGKHILRHKYSKNKGVNSGRSIHSTCGNISRPPPRSPGEKVYKCDKCNKSFTRKDHLTRHNSCAHGSNSYNRESAMNASADSEKKNKFAKCVTKLQLKQTYHVSKKTFSCSQCGCDFPNKQCLIEHFRTHAKQNAFNCVECDMSYSCESGLGRHMRAMHKKTNNDSDEESDRDSSSDESEEDSDSESTVSSNSSAKVKDKNSDAEPDTPTHEPVPADSSRQSEEKQFKCPSCDSSFLSESDLAQHPCTACQKDKPDTDEKSAFNTSRNKTVRRTFGDCSEHNQYKCEECDDSFEEKDELLIHFRKHTNVKLSKTRECSAEFALIDDLKKRARPLSDETPYRCQECTAAFSCVQSLVLHIRLHTDDKANDDKS